jgi:hypothetical protein
VPGIVKHQTLWKASLCSLGTLKPEIVKVTGAWAYQPRTCVELE